MPSLVSETRDDVHMAAAAATRGGAVASSIAGRWTATVGLAQSSVSNAKQLLHTAIQAA